ncbi:MAG: hypothetical protein RLZZ200_509 [Pseudomonadota bacterium]|jgi:hypothetical protein
MSTEEMTDSEMWRAHKEQGQAKRASNRENSARLLTEAGIPFESKNNGAHLVVAGYFDFWPGTGLFMARGSKTKSYGVRNLIERAKARGAC